MRLAIPVSNVINMNFIPLVSFVFNWLGFFAAYCMTKTVAGRYGAISGFGLSVVKWVLILKVSGEFSYSLTPDNSNPLQLYNSNLPLTQSNFHFPSDHFLHNFTLNNSNVFLFPLRVRIIRSRLY